MPGFGLKSAFYSAIQTLRGAIVESLDGSKYTYFSAYLWNLPIPQKTVHSNPRPIKTSAVKWGKVIESGDEENEWNELVRLVENWFDYYWGPGVIHTIAFDFDDTIVDTYRDKIAAWICAVDETLNTRDNADHFLSEVIPHFGKGEGDKFTYVKRLVDMYPGKDELLRCILKDEAPRAISDFLEKKRKTYRHNALFPPNRTVQELAAHIAAKLFPSVRSALAGLVRLGYSLAVASLTDEENIEKALNIVDISCIDTIVGKNEYKDRELSNYLAEKIYLIRKIANLAGVPVSRVLYIGDHHRDERAAIEVGASFIHARLIRQVEASEDAETLYFEDYGKLPVLVSEVESRVRARDFSPQRPKHYA